MLSCVPQAPGGPGSNGEVHLVSVAHLLRRLAQLHRDSGWRPWHETGQRRPAGRDQGQCVGVSPEQVLQRAFDGGEVELETQVEQPPGHGPLAIEQ